MAHFVYPAGTPLGVVPFGYVVPSAEWASTLAQLFKAVNGDEGGTWAPSSFLTIGGSGLQLTGTAHTLAASARLNVESAAEIRLKNGALLKADGSVGDIRLEVLTNVATLTAQAASVVNLDGTTNVKGDVTFKSTGPATLALETGVTATWQSGASATFQDGSTATFGGTVVFSATAAITLQTGATLTAQNTVVGTWNGPWTCGSTLAVTGASTFSSTVTCNSSLAVGTNATIAGNAGITGNATVGGTLGVTGATTLAGAAALSSTLAVSGVSTFSNRVVRSGATAYAELRIEDGPDSTTTIDAYEADVWNAPLTNNRTWTISNGPAGKAFAAYFVAPASHTLTLSATGFSATLSRTALSGDYKAITALWTGTEWLNLEGPTV